VKHGRRGGDEAAGRRCPPVGHGLRGVVEDTAILITTGETKMRADPTKPRVSREKVGIGHVRDKLAENIDWKSLGSFLRFLERLDPATYEIFLDEENGPMRRTGYRVIHFTDDKTDSWNNTFGTYFGLSACFA
jgi:hypothetical protein